MDLGGPPSRDGGDRALDLGRAQPARSLGQLELRQLEAEAPLQSSARLGFSRISSSSTGACGGSYALPGELDGEEQERRARDDRGRVVFAPLDHASVRRGVAALFSSALRDARARCSSGLQALP